MPSPGLNVTRVTPGLSWQAAEAGQTAGTVGAWARPDQRCAVFFDSCRADAYAPLVAAVAEDLGRDLYVNVDENDQTLSRYGDLGFVVSRRESYYLIPTSPKLTGLVGDDIPAGLDVISAGAADEDRLRLLDDALRQDVPGADGWQWDAEGFRRETFSAAFDPATYLVAVEQASGQYAGLVRVWNEPDGPRLGLVAVLARHRRRGLASALLARAFRVLDGRGRPSVTAEIDDTNLASLSLLTGLGAQRTGSSIELIRRFRAPQAGKEPTMAGFADLVMVDLECADPPVLAEFYHHVLGWNIAHSQADYAEIGDGSIRVRFGRVDGYEAPGWPDSVAPKRYHLDLQVDHVAEAVERCLELGASKPEFQPGVDRWTVLTDPAGHPFCLFPAQAG